MVMVIAAISLTVAGWPTESYADTPPFPDLSSYTPVNVADYTIELDNPGRPEPGQAVYFLTPSGIACKFISPPEVRCTGNNFPGITPAAVGTNVIGTDITLRQTGDPIGSDNAVQGHPIQTLPALHSITVNGVICGVDNAGMTACKDPQGQGFVLSPQGTSWLPHV